MPTVIPRRHALSQQIRPRQREWFPLPVHEHTAPATLVVDRGDCASQAVEREARLQIVYSHAAADLVLSRVDTHVVRCHIAGLATNRSHENRARAPSWQA